MGYKRGNKRPVNSFGIRTNCNTQKEFIEIFFIKERTKRTDLMISLHHSFAILLKMKKNELHLNLGPLFIFIMKEMEKEI